MERNTLVLAVSPLLVSFAPGKRVIPRRLRITLWQTHSWTKEIIRLRKRRGRNHRRNSKRRLETCRDGPLDNQVRSSAFRRLRRILASLRVNAELRTTTTRYDEWDYSSTLLPELLGDL
jgi:hypothetical protein